MVFLELQWEPGVYSQVMAGMAIQFRVCSATSRLLSSYDGCLINLNWLGRTIWMLLQLSHETEGHFIVGTVILGFLTIFKRCQGN